ncbi:MAG: T9SS type A sorting domain-containing protein, partial [Crocinitomicaceae bacterium]
MSIFPNPTNGSVFVKNQGSSEVFNLELTDVNGKVIVSKNAAVNGAETTEISLGKLESGFYLIRVFNDNADRTFRIIKE